MKLSQITIDTKTQEEGVWREHPYFDGVELLVCSQHSERPRKRSRVLLNRVGRKARKPGDAAEEAEHIQLQVLADCVNGWKGIESDSGEPIEFDRDLLRGWAEEPEYRRFFDGIADIEADVSTMTKVDREATEGN